MRAPGPIDDGTRTVRIIGCEFRLSETEILNWLSCFGEVISEITEEQFENDGLDPDLPPVGNGLIAYVCNFGSVVKQCFKNWTTVFSIQMAN